MIDSVIGLFTFCGNVILGGVNSVLSCIPLTTTAYLVKDNPDMCTTSLVSTSITSALNNSSSASEINTQVVETDMVIESMSLEELCELRDMVDEKENTLKLHI